MADDEFVREAVAEALRNGGYSVIRERGGAPLERILLDSRPHLVVMDVDGERLSERSGIVRRLRSASDVPLVVLTSSGRVEDRLAGLEAGADEVLGKPFSLAELVFRVRAILRRCGHREGRLQVGDLVLDEPAHLVERNGVLLDLTAIEFSLLATLCRHQGLVLSKNQLLNRIWGFDHYDVNLVEVHVSALRRKLEGFGPRIVHTVRGVGYVLRAVDGAMTERRSEVRRHDEVERVAS
ncbi:MAG: response regulator transcription factor [Acidimicrobiales bacterium]